MVEETLLRSIAENMEKFGYDKGSVTVLVVNDMPRNARGLADFDEAIRRMSARIQIIYYDHGRIDEFLADLRRRFQNICDYISFEPGKRGFGGVRSLALLLGLYHSAPDTLITFLDDDVSLSNQVAAFPSRFDHAYDYFGTLDRIFADSSINIVGGGYTRDTYETPWLAIQLLNAIEMFFDSARGMGPDQPAIDILRKIFEQSLPAAAPWSEITYDPSTLPLGFEISCHDLLRLLAASCNNLKKYNSYRLVPTVYEPRYNEGNVLLKPEPYMVGGNITFRRNVITEGVPYATSAWQWRGEDMLWTILNYRILGGVWKANIPVGHFKTRAGPRDAERDDARDLAFEISIGLVRQLAGPEIDWSKGSPQRKPASREQLADALQQCINISELGDFKDWPHAWYLKGDFERYGIARWQDTARKIEAKAKDPRAWWAAYPFLIEVITKYAKYLQEPATAERIRSQVASLDDIIHAVNQYGCFIELWPRIVNAVEEKRITDIVSEERAAIEAALKVAASFRRAEEGGEERAVAEALRAAGLIEKRESEAEERAVAEALEVAFKVREKKRRAQP